MEPSDATRTRPPAPKCERKCRRLPGEKTNGPLDSAKLAQAARIHKPQCCKGSKMELELVLLYQSSDFMAIVNFWHLFLLGRDAP